MAVTLSAGNFAHVILSGQTNHVVVVPADVPAGATIVVAFLNRSDTTTTPTGCSDPVNGAYTERLTTSSGAAWLFAYEFSNSAALTGAANRTVTVVTAGAINSQVIAGFVTSDAGALTFEEATAWQVETSNITEPWSRSFSADGAGIAIGVIGLNNAQSAITPNSGETQLPAGYVGGQRLFMFGETYASAGTPDVNVTLGGAASGRFAACGWLEAAGGPTPLAPTFSDSAAGVADGLSGARSMAATFSDSAASVADSLAGARSMAAMLADNLNA